MYAVEPALVRQAPRMDAGQVLAELDQLGFDADLLVLSGGNPALHDITDLVARLTARKAELHVETQGTRFKPWLNYCDLVVVSPKPPSSGMAAGGIESAARFAEQLTAPWVLKFVAFDEADLDWAVAALEALTERLRGDHYQGAYLSAGTEQATDDLVGAAVDRYRWLTTRALQRDDLAPFIVGLQQHVLAWPGERGR